MIPLNNQGNQFKMKGRKKYILIFICLVFQLSAKAQVWNSVGNLTFGGGTFFKEIDGLLYVSQPDTADGISTYNFGVWNGSAWDSVGGGVDGAVYGVEKINNDLIVAGEYYHAGGPSISIPISQRIRNIARWDGVQYNSMPPYSSLGNGNSIEASATFNGEIYFGGAFMVSNGAPCNKIAKWNGSSFSCVGLGTGITGTFSEVKCMIVFNGELFVGGRMDDVCGVPVNNIARWNGIAWSAAGDGFDYYVRGFTIDSLTNTLYASGTFSYSGTTQVNHIARWDGITWQPIGNGLPTGGAFQCAFYHNKLYVAGTGIPGIGGIYYWDGTNWILMNPSPNNTTFCLYPYKDELYVGGGFDSIGAVHYPGMARYSDVVGFNEIASKKNVVKIIPNPLKNYATISLPEFLNDKLPLTFKLFDTSGKPVLEYAKVNSLNFEINKSNLQKGIYFYKLLNDNYEIASGKLIIE